MAALNLQIDHVATLREVRKTRFPDPVTVAAMAEVGGVDGIVVHLREDRRHVQDRDLRILRKTLQTRLILKMTASSEMLGVALNVKPDAVLLVPESREEAAMEGGLDLMVHKTTLAETIGNLENSGIPVGVVINPDPGQIKLAHQCNAKFVQVHTGGYCEATTSAKRGQLFSRIVDAIKLADRLNIGVHIGNRLCYKTVPAFREISEIDEFNIGHSLIARALMVGMEQAVRDMRRLIQQR
ncbi:MAG TPA: pyridoxine 5'-phosphate synthase [Desulfobacterales bacterium]|mgnify:CR=1 FL=1